MQPVIFVKGDEEMVIPVEREDVDVKRLFYWNRKFEVVDKNGNVVDTLYIRVAGDADVSRARVAALRASSKLRKSLQDVNSEERLINIPGKDDLAREMMVEAIALLSLRDFRKDADKEVKLKIPVEPPADAPLEEHERYRAEVDEFQQKHTEAVKEYIEKRVTGLKSELDSKTDDELYKIYERLLINGLCEDTLYKTYVEWLVFYSVYKDPDFKQRYFSSFDEFDNLPSNLKQDIIDAYNELELSADDLKKLRQAAQS